MQCCQLFVASEYLDETTLKDTISSVVTQNLDIAEICQLPIKSDWPTTSSVHGCVLLPCCSPLPEEEVLSGVDWETWDEKTWHEGDGRHCHTASCTQQVTLRDTDCGLAERIHRLSEKLPKYGAVLEIIWMVGDNTLPPVCEDINLFGALKRLVEWHHGHVSIIPVSPVAERAPYLQEWVSLLKAAVLHPSDLNQYLPSAWNGTVSVLGSKEVQSAILPGFRLCQMPKESGPKLKVEGHEMRDDNVAKILSGQMDFLTAVLRFQVPSFLYSGVKFRLTVPSECPATNMSREFLKHLVEDPLMGYLVRLPWGTKWRHVSDSGQKSKRGGHSCQDTDWKDLIKDDLSNVTGPPCEFELDGKQGIFHFLLSSDGNFIQAHLLHPVERLNGALGHTLARLELASISQGQNIDSQNGKDMAIKFLEQIPHYAGSTLLTEHNEIEKLQIETMKHWIENRSSEISADELIGILAGVRKCYLEHLQNTGQVITGIPKCAVPPDHLITPIPEDQVDYNSQLERLALQLSEHHRSLLAKHKSSDSLAGLSPPPKGPVVTLDVREFLKHFTADGTAMKSDLEVLVPKIRTGMSRFDNTDVVKLSWPDCLEVKYHGIHYNLGDKAEKLEMCSNKLNSRLAATETASTCTQAKAPATMPLTPKPKPKKQNIEENEDLKERPEGDVLDTRSRAKKRKSTESTCSLTAEGKRLIAARKKRLELQASRSQSKRPLSGKLTDSGQQEGRRAQGRNQTESRSQRHKRKLEEVVSSTLQKNGLKSEDPIFSTCAKKLFTLVKVFIKDLTTWQSLREEMTKIAEDHVQQVIEFEKKRQEKLAAK